MTGMRGSTVSVPATLLLGCLGLLWLNYNFLQARPSAEPAVPLEVTPPHSETALPATPELRFPPLGRFTETLERPLFSPTRRRPEVKAVVEKSVPRKPLDLVLKGIIFSQKERVAVVSLRKNRSREKTILRLPEGAIYQGWTLQEIAPRTVTFRRGNAKQDLKLLYSEQIKGGKKLRSTRSQTRTKG